MANDLTINQIYTIVNEVNKQATGSNLTVIDTSSFITVGQTILKCGYDTVMQSISQVLSKTIFSTRPYNRKFPSLMVTNQQYGNHVRKLQVVDKEFEKDERYNLDDGVSVDMYKVKKPELLQTNFYGEEVFQKTLTRFKDQIDVAFSSPDEFGRFIVMVLQNVSDMIEQAHENISRMILCNFIGGKIVKDNGVIHLLTEYNEMLGRTGSPSPEPYSIDEIYSPEVFPSFVKWAYARIGSLSDLLTERSTLYHINVDGKPVQRHTPKKNQKLYMLNSFINNVNTSVLSSVYNDGKLSIGAFESVNFWQNIQNPTSIRITPSVLENDGTVKKGAEVFKSSVIGCIFDDEALGYTIVNNWTATTPLNTSGGYTNTHWHFTDRYWNDFTENGIVFCLD